MSLLAEFGNVASAKHLGAEFNQNVSFALFMLLSERKGCSKNTLRLFRLQSVSSVWIQCWPNKCFVKCPCTLAGFRGNLVCNDSL